MGSVQRRKRLMVEGLQEFHLNQTMASGANLFRGEARFVGARALEVDLRDGGKKTISGDRCLSTWVLMPLYRQFPDWAKRSP